MRRPREMRRWRSSTGASAVETAFLLLLIVVVAAAGVAFFGIEVQDIWEQSADGSDGVMTPAPTVTSGTGNAGGGGSGIPGVPTTTTTASPTTTTTVP